MSNFDKTKEIFTKHERKYDSSKYKDLEIMKIKIKDM